MKYAEIKETLEKQLKLLSERSEKSDDPETLCHLTAQMVSLGSLLIKP